MSHFTLDTDQASRANTLVKPALVFLNEQRFGLGTALVGHHWNDVPSADVIDQLAVYQNEDGGFGRNLEVDIKAPASNPFAARLAMRILLSLRDRPTSPIVERLGVWLRESQDPDGDWHFSNEVYEGQLPPWFATWTFPSLNPACCLAGLGNQLGIAKADILPRVARLFSEKASPEEASTGEFYNVLPYVEYLGGVEVPDRAVWLDAVAHNVIMSAEGDGYADAGHFFEHALGGGPDLVKCMPEQALHRQADRLLLEAQADGGWPSAYDAAWRPSLTASALSTLAMLRDGV